MYKRQVLIGAGKKGKAIAQLLKESNSQFVWYTNNSKKIGHDIYGVVVQDIQTIVDSTRDICVIVAIANEEDKLEIQNLTKSKSNITLFPFA